MFPLQHLSLPPSRDTSVYISVCRGSSKADAAADASAVVTPATPEKFGGWGDVAPESESEHPVEDAKDSIDAMSVRTDEEFPEKLCNLNNN